MKIEQLSLTHFRNIESQNLVFDKDVTVIVGKNGQGKTNILEAIHYCSTSRSFRVKEDQLCIQFNQNLSRIIGVFFVKEHRKQLKVIINQEGKYLFENNKSFSTNKEFIGLVNTVLFSPNDLFLFDGYPKGRRKFIDSELSKLFPEYVEALFSYNKLLKERNTYLKQNSIDKDYISVLDDQMIEFSIIILKYRYQFIDYLNTHVPKLFQNLIEEKGWNIDISLESDIQRVENLREVLKNLYQQSLQKDILFRSTQIGIHKDDLTIKINDQDLINIASQGQKRMMIIAMKLCLIHYIKEKINEFPILLLDDVFSEIDEAKRKRFIEFLPKTCQTIVTTTDISHVQLWSQERYSVITVSNGNVVKE
jgi:DNA replication and repair protein RecF